MNYHIEVVDGIGEVLQVWDCDSFVHDCGVFFFAADNPNEGSYYKLPEGAVLRVTETVHGGFDQ